MKIIIFCFLIFTIKKCSSTCDFFNKDVSKTKLTIYNIYYPNGTTLTAGTIIPSTELFVLTHEWLYDSQVEWIAKTRPNLLRLYPNANVIVIDYSPYSNNLYFIPNVCTSPYVGKTAADKLIYLNADPSLISCTGHSLGAQVCGAFARHFIEQNKGQIARITGLDAAGPTFDNNNYVARFTLQKHVSKADAKLVVGIYTDSNGWGSGMNQNSGYSHISIIINAGFNQPPCKNALICPLSQIISLGQEDLMDCVFCSHRFSREVYKRAMGGRHYIATKCDNYNDYKAGICNANPSFVYTDKLDRTITDGIYYININSNFQQIVNSVLPQ